MIKYFLIFVAIGFAAGRFLPNPRVAFACLGVLAILWGGRSGTMWGLVAFGELALGFFAATALLPRKTPASTESPAARPDGEG